ncbi:MAG: family 10 glycosylhydrolase, partial [Clostridia bacterium]|nr:family 10 glycosylhydrolase [Clostridia bacterium]
LPLDCLEYFITAAHSKGIELHAWVNPYRIMQSGNGGHNLSLLAESNPARLHPEWVVKHTDGASYYNPGIPEVRKLIIDGILEIVNNYNIDGIHFDDYFYPYTDASKFADSAEYEKYKSEGQSLADWRRSNNDALISQTVAAVKNAKPNVAFGISPSGVWALKMNNSLGTDIKSSSESYYQVYADTRKWVLNEWIDYICPQIYWEIDHSTAPFKPIADWWDDLVSTTKVKLYIGLAAYKGASVAAYKSPSEIQNQLNYLKTKSHVSGSVMFSYKDLAKNLAGIQDTAKTYYKNGETGVEAASDKLVLSYSSLSVENSTTKTFIIGVSDPNYPLYIDGKEVTTRSPKGYFTHVVEVPKIGENHYKIEHKGETVDYIIKRAGKSSDITTMSSFGFVSGTCAPKYDRAEKSGESITFACTATAGANVYVIIGDYTVNLTTTDRDSTDGSLKRAWYSGTFVLPEIEGNAVLGNPEFVIEKSGYDTVRHKGSNVIEVINDPESYVVEFTGDFPAQLKPNLKVTGEEYLYATIGAYDTVVSKYDGNTLLGSGYYTVNENVKRVENTSIPYSATGTITVSQSADGKYTNIVIPTDGKTMNTIWMSDTKADITLYNLSALPAGFSLPENPLFKDATVSRVDSTTAKITLTYKKELYIFGYTTSFENGALIIAFKNPVSLYDSTDYPLYGIRISLDPGHSLNGGALGPWGRIKWTEADWNYELSRLVETRLIQLGATVYLTHHRELEKDLDPLILEYRAWKPDINVSIHFNYVGETANPLNTSGTVTYYSYTSSKLLSKVMLDEFT